MVVNTFYFIHHFDKYKKSVLLFSYYDNERFANHTMTVPHEDKTTIANVNDYDTNDLEISFIISQFRCSFTEETRRIWLIDSHGKKVEVDT